MDEMKKDTPEMMETNEGLHALRGDMRRWYQDTGEKEGLKRKGKREEIFDELYDNTDTETQITRLKAELEAMKAERDKQFVEWEGWDEWEELKLEEGRRLRREVEVLRRDGKASAKEDLSVAKIAA